MLSPLAPWPWAKRTRADDQHKVPNESHTPLKYIRHKEIFSVAFTVPSPASLGGKVRESRNIPCWKGSQRRNPRGVELQEPTVPQLRRALLGVPTGCSCPMEAGWETTAGSGPGGSAEFPFQPRTPPADRGGHAWPCPTRCPLGARRGSGIHRDRGKKRPKKWPIRTEGSEQSVLPGRARRAFTEGAALPSKWGCDNGHNGALWAQRRQTEGRGNVPIM